MVQSIGHETVVFSGLVGAVVALLGTLYMAYDLFGHRHGLLRVLTETITYVIVGVILGTAALGVIALDAVLFDPYFVRVVSVPGAIAVLLAWGASAGFGAGLGYVLTIEQKWNAGHPKHHPDQPVRRILLGAALGVLVGVLAYVVMANFRHTHDVETGIFWGAIQGPPMGLMFGFLVAFNQVYFNQQVSASQRRSHDEHITLLTITLEPHETHVGEVNERSDQQQLAVDLVLRLGDGPDTANPVAAEPAVRQRLFDKVGLWSGVATGLSVGPITAMSYFALYGPFVPQTFATISIAGIIGGTGLGLVLATAERALLWVDRLPPKRLGTAGAFFVILGFLFQAIQQFSQIGPVIPAGR